MLFCVIFYSRLGPNVSIIIHIYINNNQNQHYKRHVKPILPDRYNYFRKTETLENVVLIVQSGQSINESFESFGIRISQFFNTKSVQNSTL